MATKLHGLSTLLVTAALLAPVGQAQSQTAPAPLATPSTAPLPESANTTVSEVTVTGKINSTKPTASSRVLRLDTSSASSCAFSSSSDSLIEDFIASMSISRTGDRTASGPVATVDEAGEATYATPNTYFSENAIWGDASTTGEIAVPEGCSTFGSDRAFLAGRAAIARRDKTLPQGFAFYDQGKYAEAMEMFKAAYAKLPDKDGGVDAAFMAGKIGLERPELKIDQAQTITWLIRAAGAAVNIQKLPAFNPKRPYDNISPTGNAALLLAQAHLVGKGAPRDPKAARKWLNRANAVGVVPAAKMLGDIHFYGYDTPIDVKEAAKYYKQAATLGFAPAQYALAEIYYRGDLGASDVKAALPWYQEAANADHPGAQYALALAYEIGEGVPVDRKRALSFYASAAANGNAEAQSALGSFFYQGDDLIAKDAVTARKWFEAAATKGQADAMFNLAAMQAAGEGGEKDMVKAWVWMNLATRSGHPNASAAMTKLEPRMSAAEKQAAAAYFRPKTRG